MCIDKTKNLSQLLAKGWNEGIPENTDSFVIRNSYKLYHEPLSEFDVEELRFMIGQKFGLEYLIPMAIDILEEDMLAEGDYYEGDLLKNVLTIDSEYWDKYPSQKEKVKEIFGKNREAFIEFETTDEIKDSIMRAFHDFTSDKSFGGV